MILAVIANSGYTTDRWGAGRWLQVAWARDSRMFPDFVGAKDVRHRWEPLL